MAGEDTVSAWMAGCRAAVEFQRLIRENAALRAEVAELRAGLADPGALLW